MSGIRRRVFRTKFGARLSIVLLIVSAMILSSCVALAAVPPTRSQNISHLTTSSSPAIYYDYAGFNGNNTIYPTYYTAATTLPVLSASHWQTAANASQGVANIETVHMSNVSNLESLYYNSPNNIFTIEIIFSATGGSWAFNPGDYTTWYQDVSAAVAGLPSDADTQWIYYHNTGLNITATTLDPTTVADEIYPVINVGLDAAGLLFPEVSVPIGLWQLMTDFTGVMGVWSDSNHNNVPVYDGSDGTINQWAAVDNGTYGDCGDCGSTWVPQYDGYNVFAQGVFVQTIFSATDTLTLSPGSITFGGCNQIRALQPGICAVTGFSIAPAVSIGGTVRLYPGGPVSSGAQVTLQQSCTGTPTEDFVETTNSVGFWHFFANPSCTYTESATGTNPYQGGTLTSPTINLPESVLVEGDNFNSTTSPAVPVLNLGAALVTFTETGLSTGQFWLATLNGATESAGLGSAITFLEQNGTFAYTIPALGGYTASPSKGNVNVTGQPVSVAVKFTKVSTYSVTFSEGGLPSGNTWTVTLGGTAESAAAGSGITFSGLAGGYDFSVASVTVKVSSTEACLYVPNPSSGTVTGTTSISVTYGRTSTCITT